MKVDTSALTIYGGGTGAGFYSIGAQATEAMTPNAIPLMAFPVPVIEVTLGDLIAMGSFAIVCLRFWLDTRSKK